MVVSSHSGATSGSSSAYVARRIITFELFDAGFGQVYRRQPIGEIIVPSSPLRLRRQVDISLIDGGGPSGGDR